jgi:cytochrome c
LKTRYIAILTAATLLSSGCSDQSDPIQNEERERASLPAPPAPPTPPKEAKSEAPVTGESLYRSCIPCHGAGGQKPALGVGEAIAGWEADRLIETISAYRGGTLNSHGMGGMMSAQARALSDDDIQQLAEHISGL